MLDTAVLNGRDWLARWWSDHTRSDEERRKTLTILSASSGAAALAIGLGLYFWLRPIPQPDYDTAGMDEVFNYTLLTDEFNALPVEERMKLIGQLVNRLKNMDAGDSVLMASFAAGIAGAARDQIQQNGARLAIDMWDKYAKDYDKVKPEERSDFLEQVFVDMTKTVEALGGEPREVSDADRINEVRQQANRDRAALREGRVQPPPEAIGRVAAFMNNAISTNQNAAQRARGAQMMRDMVRHFRNQDIATGKPKTGPG
ncbi:MAG: hypothetical protein HBSAPP03_19210 [Phycisphaerae bacterium]|nr:MAG: hypothetical protein HBSAPP03_19210 [Phycisphaerae bacterium]